MQLGPREERLLITGLHTVADISCAGKERDKERELAIPPRRLVSLKKTSLDLFVKKKQKNLFPGCAAVLGWKYEQAFEESQRYKEGRFIVEKAKVVKEGEW